MVHEKGIIRFLGKGFNGIGLDATKAGRSSLAAGYTSGTAPETQTKRDIAFQELVFFTHLPQSL